LTAAEVRRCRAGRQRADRALAVQPLLVSLRTSILALRDSSACLGML
jgi:hypothetical protein